MSGIAEVVKITLPKVGPFPAASVTLTWAVYGVVGVKPVICTLCVVARVVTGTVMLPTVTVPVVGLSVCHPTTTEVEVRELKVGPETMDGGVVSMKVRTKLKRFPATTFNPDRLVVPNPLVTIGVMVN